MGYWPIVKRVIKDSDIVLIVQDARMPEISRNSGAEKLAKQHKTEILKVFTKRDLISQKRIKELIKEYPSAVFVSGTKNLNISLLKKTILIWAKRNKIDKPVVGILGYPNVGKSAITNVLSKAKKTSVSRIAGTTKGLQWVKAGSLRILDSPGVIPFEDSEMKLGILGAKNPEKLKKPQKVALAVIKLLIEANKKTLENYYGIKIEDDDEEYDVFLAVGEKRKFLMKKGEVDENRTTFQILRDWQSGKIGN